MTEVVTALGALRDGAAFALQYNPLAALATAVVAAAMWGHPRARREHWEWALLVLAAGWLAGDGLRILAHARDFADGVGPFRAGGAPEWIGWTKLGVWAAGSLALGYVIPAIVGGSVGRRVTHGTGWLAAGVIAGTLTVVVASAVGALG